MQRVYWRKNRKTKLLVWLIKWDRLGSGGWFTEWWAECAHGNDSRTTTVKSETLRNMAHPDEWCNECAAIVARRKNRAISDAVEVG